MNEKEIIDHHHIISKSIFERASNSLGEMRAKITDLDWDYKDRTQWADWESDVLNALRKMQSVYKMIHDYGRLLSPDEILENMKSVNDEYHEVKKLQMDTLNSGHISSTHKLKIDNLLTELSSRASHLRIMYKPNRFEDLDMRIEQEILWAEEDMNGLDIEQVESRLENLRNLINQAFYVYGWEDEGTIKLMSIRQAYQHAYGRKLEDRKPATTRVESLVDKIDNLYDLYCKGSLGS